MEEPVTKMKICNHTCLNWRKINTLKVDTIENHTYKIKHVMRRCAKTYVSEMLKCDRELMYNINCNLTNGIADVTIRK